MTTPFADCAQNVGRLHRAVLALEKRIAPLGMEDVVRREWFRLLEQKLIPQLPDDAYLVAAVVGGTNIGKSVIFNHLAGSRASATSPLASGTKHPVAIVPLDFARNHALESVFPDFEPRAWTDSDGALQDTDADLLFWKSEDSLPDNLLVLDTPDIDSDARVNWERADNIRRAADVLIAVLTQQKYNDAAVKQFFRKAAQEDRTVLVVFNQCELPEDEAYWPVWLETFCGETGLDPDFVYVAPNDRRAAEENRLPFYQRRRLSGEVPAEQHDVSHDLTEALSRLHFGEIKLQALRGSLAHVTEEETGVPTWLREISRRSSEFRSAAEVLSAHTLAKIDDWPAIPNGLLIAEMRTWWAGQREGWSADVHNFYNALGRGLVWPFRMARRTIAGEETPAIVEYQRSEWNAILKTVEKVYERLTWFGELGNELLRPRIAKLLTGNSRADLIRILEDQHSQIDLEAELSSLVSEELRTFREESPQFYSLLKKIDVGAAAARPVTSIALFVTGLGPAGDAAAQLVAGGAMQSIMHVAGDVAGGTVAAAVGEATLSGTAASGVGYIEAKLRQLHAAFTARRAGWLAEMLKEHLFGSLPEDLQTAAMMVQSREFLDVQQALEQAAHGLHSSETAS